MKKIIAAALLATLAVPAAAESDDLVRVKAGGAVDKTMDALQMAVEAAGATVFARVDHAKGAEEAGMYLRPEELLIFGNPQLGSLVMQDNPLAGLYLPTKVLVYEDADGQTWLVYEEPEEMLDGLDLPEDAEYLQKMDAALKNLTTEAAGG